MTMTQAENQLILEVPLNPGSNDYEAINYSNDYPWTQDDQDNIQTIIEEFSNCFDTKGEKTINTSVGKIKITYQLHPTVTRRKLIKGFLVEPLKVKPELKQESPFVYLLSGSLPDWITNDNRAEKLWDLFKEEIETLNLENDDLISELFLSKLDYLESKIVSLINDENQKTRLNDYIKNLKNFKPQPEKK